MPRDLLPLVRQALGNQYQVEREIGRGGAAVVFLARNPEGIAVALKVLRPELAVTVAAQRFLQEISFLSRLSHPHIGGLIDSGEKDWLIYYVMPYWDGPSLQQYLTKYRRLRIDDALRLARDLLDALAHAHGQNIVHRDVKPDNIILTPDGAVLLDFGIARAIALSGQTKLTRSGIAIGTSAYMSPEQITALRELDHRSDIYSLGCVLFEAIAGRGPFAHPNEAVVLNRHLNEPPPSLRTLAPDTPQQLDTAILRALAKKPEERWPSARAMLDALSKLP
ncbi:MAG TPA: serine/threonine-protein kinase [Gemmatimonadales bacterium]|nr:serine/threonine-protein kinase [Gemmatimonadales bacterium]